MSVDGRTRFGEIDRMVEAIYEGRAKSKGRKPPL